MFEIAKHSAAAREAMAAATGLRKEDLSAVRANALFRQQQEEIYRQTDQLFAKLMFWQWIGCVVMAILISPYTWDGQTSAIHIHVWAAIFLGGAMSLFPIWMTRAWPGAAITRHVIAVAQMLMSALLISITGGRIETHFHVFGSLVILSFYRDWRVLVPATIVVGLDHFLRGVYWPYSVYGVLAASPWRSIEHAAWVVFEDVFLVISCFRSIREMRSIASRTAALEASGQVYHAMLDSALDCIITIDRHGRIREFNPAAEKVFGFTPAEAVGQEMAELIIPPRLRERHRQDMAQYLETGNGHRIEIDALRKDGSEILVELTVSSLQVDGSPLFTAYLREITDRVRSERRRVAQYAVAKLINSSQDPEKAAPEMLKEIASIGSWVLGQLWVVDESAEKLHLQSAWQEDAAELAKFTEFSRSFQFTIGQGLPGRVWESGKPAWISDISVDPNFPRLRVAIETGLRGGFAFPLFAGPRFLGVIEIFSRGIVQPDNDLLDFAPSLGSQIGLFVLRHRAEGALQEKTRQLLSAVNANQLIMDHSQDVICTADAEGRFLSLNAACEQLWGYKPDEMIGRHYLDFVYSEDHSKSSQAEADLRVSGRINNFVNRYVRKDGALVDVLWSASWSEKEKIFFAIAHDITERKRAEEQIRDLNQSLEQRVRERTLELRREIKERLLVERSLVASEERYRTLFERNPEPMWVFDCETLAFLEVNQAAVNHYGYSREEFLKMTLRHIRPVEDIPALLEDIERLQPGNASSPQLWRHRKKDGTIIDAAITANDFQWNGRPARLVLAIDMTERKRAEEAVRAAEQKYRAIFENSIEGIFQSRPDGKWINVNPALARMYGYDSPAELMATDGSQLFVDSERRTEFKQLMEDQGFVEGFEFEVHRKDGSTMWLSENSRAIRDSEGKIIYYEGAVQDVTERRQAEAALRAAERKYRTIFENAIEGIFQTTPEGTYLSVNPALARMYGYDSPEELMAVTDIGRVIYVNPERRKQFQRLIEEQGFVELFEYEVYRKDGRKILLCENARAVRDANGKIKYYEGTVEDITERKRIQEVERANKAKNEFLSRMSHELRTPLNAILGFAQLLERQKPTETQRARLQHILNAGKHLLNLINEVLDISRIEAGKMQVSLEPVSVADALAEALELVRHLASEHDVKLSADADLDASVYVMADRQRLKQVLLNLLTNGVKYTPSSGSIAVSYQAGQGDTIRIRVTDTGPGIPGEKLESLFVPFERLGAEQSNIEGTGLGLALSKRLIEAMGGSIGVGSELGKGSTFWIELARATSPVETAASRKAQLALSRESLGQAARKILYIEDNLSNLTLIEEMLEEHPEIELLSAMQGKLGLELARQHLPDLILLDLHLPDLPGWQVLARLKGYDKTRPIPVVVVSADATPRQIKRLMSAGAATYLTKPLDVGEFFRVLAETKFNNGSESSVQSKEKKLEVTS